MFSKHAWVQPLKSKTGKAVTEAMAKILKGGRKPINLQMDNGKEFYNKTFQDLMKQKGRRLVGIQKPVWWNGSIGP